MVMIRCPDCGQRVLDVASSCPKCGHVLIQNPMETHGWGSLRACGRCGKHIERDAHICPYCGYHVRAAQIAARVTVTTAAVVILVVAGVWLWRSGVVGSWGDDPARERPVTEQPASSPPPTMFPPQAPDTVHATPIVAAAPDSTGRDNAVAAATGQPAARTPAAAVRTLEDIVTRWTLEWANVRAARSVQSSVVQVLPPGRAVEVREMQRGWWAVYASGTVVGYIANSVLSDVPPG